MTSHRTLHINRKLLVYDYIHFKACGLLQLQFGQEYNLHIPENNIVTFGLLVYFHITTGNNSFLMPRARSHMSIIWSLIHRWLEASSVICCPLKKKGYNWVVLHANNHWMLKADWWIHTHELGIEGSTWSLFEQFKWKQPQRCDIFPSLPLRYPTKRLLPNNLAWTASHMQIRCVKLTFIHRVIIQSSKRVS